MGPVGGASRVPSREELIRMALKRSRASKRTPLGEKKKFLKHSVRAKLARTMTGRTVASRSADLEAVPSGGLQSCFMRDAIENESMKNPSAAYNQFYRAIFPMVQSQALLLHNQHRIVDLIVEHLGRPDRVDPSLPYNLRTVEGLGVPSILRVVQVLGKDLQAKALHKDLMSLVEGCLKRVDVNDVDISTLAFQTVGILFEHCADVILEADPKLEFQTKLYPLYLGQRSPLLRNLSAEVFSYLIRQLPPNERKKHIWKILKAPSEQFGLGVSALLAFVVRGIQGKLNSSGFTVLSSALRTAQRNQQTEHIDEVKGNLVLWFENLRQYSKGVDDALILDVLATACEEAPSGQWCAFLLTLVTPWLTYFRVQEQEPSTFSKFAQSAGRALTSKDLEHKSVPLTFLLDLWYVIWIKVEVDRDGLSNEVGEILRDYVQNAPGSDELDSFYLQTLSRLDFVEHFAPYLLGGLNDNVSAKVWETLSFSSQNRFAQDEVSWRATLIDSGFLDMFASTTGRISSKYLQSSHAGILRKALTTLDQASLEFLAAVEPEDKTSMGETLLGIVNDVSIELFGCALKAAVRHVSAKNDREKLVSAIRNRLQTNAPVIVFSCATLDALFELLPLGLTTDQILEIAEPVADQASSKDVQIRRAALKVLTGLFSQSVVLKTMQEIHDLEPTFDSDRPRRILADALAPHFSKKLDKVEIRTMLHGTLGLFQVRFQPAWSIAAGLLESLCRQLGGGSNLWRMGLSDFFFKHSKFEEAPEGRTFTAPDQVFTSLLTALKEGKTLLKMIKREMKSWVPTFFDFMRNEYYATRAESDLLLQEVPAEELPSIHRVGGDKDEEDEDNEGETRDEEITTLKPSGASKKLQQWLGFFVVLMEMEDQQALPQASELETIWLRMLIVEDFAVPCLKCLLALHPKEISEARSVLERIAEVRADGFKDLMVDFTTLTTQTAHVHPLFVTISSRLLYGKLMQRPGRKERFSLAQRRTAIFSAIASMTERARDEALTPLFDLMLRPFHRAKARGMNVIELNPHAAEGFLSLLKDAIRVLGKRMASSVPTMLEAVGKLLQESCLDGELQHHEGEDNKAELKAAAKIRIRPEALDRTSETIEQFSPEYDFKGFFKKVLKPILMRLAQFTPAANEAPSALLRLECVLLRTSHLTRRFLLDDCSEVFEKLLERIETGTNQATLDVLFDALHAVFDQSDEALLVPFLPNFLEKFSKRQNLGGDRELELLKLVAHKTIPLSLEQAKSNAARRRVQDLAVSLTELLLEFLPIRAKRHRHDSVDLDPRQLVLEAMLALCECLPKESLSKLESSVLPTLQVLLGPWAEGREIKLRGAREALVLLHNKLNIDQAIENGLLSDLNSFSTSRVDGGLDFEKRLGAYHKCASGLEEESEAVFSRTMVIPNQAMLDMQNNDFAIRSAAQAFLSAFIKRLDDDKFTPLVIDFFSKSVPTVLKLVKDSALRPGYLLLLRDLVLSAAKSSIAHVKEELAADMAVLVDIQDQDSDFFANAAHVQVSRRGRVLQRLAQKLDNDEIILSQRTFKNYLIPIALHGVFAETTGVSETESGLVLVSSCAAKMQDMESYMMLLQSVLKRLSKTQEPTRASRVQTRILLRCVSMIFDAFPFKDDPDAVSDFKAKFQRKLLSLLIIPSDGVNDEELNENIALSMARLCKDSEEEIDSLVLTICGQLKRRKQSARDAARNALRKVAKYLGLNAFPRIITSLISTLREGGYLFHVLCYTTFVLVDGMREDLARERQQNSAPRAFDEFRQTALDSVVDPIMEVIENELFSEKAPTSDNGYKSRLKLREQRAGKGLDTLEALASCIAFLPCESVHKLTKPFRDRLTSKSVFVDDKMVQKCRDALVHIKSGLLKNDDVRSEHLLIYVHSLLNDFIKARQSKESRIASNARKAKSWLVDPDANDDGEQAVKKGTAYADRLLYTPGVQLTGRSAERTKRLIETAADDDNENSASGKEHMLVVFALDLLMGYFFMRRKPEDEQHFSHHLDMLSPLTDMIIRELVLREGASKRAMVLGLRMCTQVVASPNSKGVLPREVAKPLVHRILKFIKQNSTSSSLVTGDVSKASIELLTEMMTSDYQDLFATDDVKLLIRIARLDLDNPHRMSVALKLLECVFNRKLLLPELYDVALRLTHLVFQTDNKNNRTRCGDLVLNFLTNFPLEDRRLQEQVDLVMKNLDFPIEDGRISGLDVLRACIMRFPVSMVDDSAEYFFLPLVMRLVNDDGARVREACAKTLLSLITRVKPNKLQRLSELTLTWFDKESAKMAACLAAGTILESNRLGAKSSMTLSLAQKLSAIITSSDSSESQGQEWTLQYNALLAFEKLLISNKAVGTLTAAVAPVEAYIPRLLVHSHAWIRLSSGRILGIRLEDILKNGVDPAKSSLKSGFDLILALVDQLDSDVLSDDQAEQSTLNLIRLIRLSERYQSWFDKGNTAEGSSRNPRAWLVKRLGLVASRLERDKLELKNKRRRAVFTIYLEVCGGEHAADDVVNNADVARVMIQAASVMHISDERARQMDPLAELRDKVLDTIKELIGADKYVGLLHDLTQQKLERRRDKRKAKLIAKVVPDQFAISKRARVDSESLRTMMRSKFRYIVT